MEEYKDLIESKLNDEALVTKKLSNGKIEGEIRVISNISVLKQILKGRSIVAESEFYKAERSDALLDFLKENKMERNKKYVFISEIAHPSLSLLMKYSAGFIFERGGMLSHLAIILRENKIPGKIENDAMKKYQNGENYMENERNV